MTYCQRSGLRLIQLAILGTFAVDGLFLTYCQRRGLRLIQFGHNRGLQSGWDVSSAVACSAEIARRYNCVGSANWIYHACTAALWARRKRSRGALLAAVQLPTRVTEKADGSQCSDLIHQGVGAFLLSVCLWRRLYRCHAVSDTVRSCSHKFTAMMDTKEPR
ncbi:unnamed protein product, partial [Iphiclides podalirius]